MLQNTLEKWFNWFQIISISKFCLLACKWIKPINGSRNAFHLLDDFYGIRLHCMHQIVSKWFWALSVLINWYIYIMATSQPINSHRRYIGLIFIYFLNTRFSSCRADAKRKAEMLLIEPLTFVYVSLDWIQNIYIILHSLLLLRFMFKFKLFLIFASQIRERERKVFKTKIGIGIGSHIHTNTHWAVNAISLK